MYAGKTVVITGASSGMGRAMAERFLAEGSNVVINARRRHELEKFVAEHVQHGDRIRFVAGDIGLRETGQNLAKTALESFGAIDVLVNNAGIFVPRPFLEETEESLDRYYSVTVKGSFFTSQAVIPAMQKKGGGSIINIGSMWVENPIEETPASASQVAKGGMHTLTRHLAIEFAKDNICVNTIAPAIIDTTLYDNLIDRDTLEGLARLHPLRRLGQLDDIVSWVMHLASPSNQFVTGQTLFIDGGITAGSHAA